MRENSFLPRGASELAELDLRMRCELADSLDYIHKTIDTNAQTDVDLRRLRAAIIGSRQHPSLFGRYFETVYALSNGCVEEAACLLGEIAILAERPTTLEITALSDTSMGGDVHRYVRLLNAGEPTQIFASHEPCHWNDFEARVMEAFDLICLADAGLGRETRELITQVIGIEPCDANVGFGSISSLTLWGAVGINLATHTGIVTVAEALVHESAHLLLFASETAEPLVDNPADARFTSPLRPDARPMNGIFHATFVCARLHLFYSQLKQGRARIFCGEESQTTDNRLRHLARRFDEGARTLLSSARLTRSGEAIFEAARAYMARSGN